MIRVSHVITGLGVGGAEMMLVKVVNGLDPLRFRSHVISLSGENALSAKIENRDVRVDLACVPATLSGGLPAIGRVRRLLRAEKPDIVQTWLYHGDLAGGIAAKSLGLPVVWNVQTSNLDPAGIRRRTIRVAEACAVVSRFVPRVIVSCSRAAVAIHTRIGYADKFLVIPNGTDLEVFRPDPEARHAVRLEFGVGEDEPVVGMVARYHAQKDHSTFLAAAQQLAGTHPHVRYLLCGLGLDASNEDLTAEIRSRGLTDRVVLMGLRFDVARILNAFDVHTLSSAFGEGFPNVLGEAMATGVPCVVTDVGDSAMIVGETGVTVPPRNPSALAAGWRTLLDLAPEKLAAAGEAARRRVAQEFSLESALARYEELYGSIRPAVR